MNSRFNRGSRGVTPREKEGIVNEAIRGSSLFLIDETGQNHGEVSKSKALDMAKAASLDLVQVGEKDGIPVTKIMDYGKFLYSKKKKLAKSKKSQKIIQVKEVKMRPSIGPGDYEVKLKAAAEFLGEGKRVKFTIQFRGRQAIPPREVGEQLFDKIKKDLIAKTGASNIVEDRDGKHSGAWTRTYYLK